MVDEHDESWSVERLLRSSYKDLGTPQEVQDRFLRHLLSLHKQELVGLYMSKSATTRDYSLEVDMFELLRADTILGFMLLRYPSTLIPLLEKAIVDAQTYLRDSVPEGEAGSVKGDTTSTSNMTRVHARLVHLPPTSCKASLHHMEATDVGKMWQLSGTVVRASVVQMYESARTYRCTGKKGCGQTFVMEADLEQCHNALVPPETCPLFGEGGERCRGTKLEAVASLHTDYQEIKIQEAASRVGVGNIPRSLLIKLQHDLVDKCQPGDEVVLVGSLLAQWPTATTPEVDCPVGLALKAHSIRVVQEKASWHHDPSVGEMERRKKEFDDFWAKPEHIEKRMAARDFICRAVCPKLYGMSMIKLALLVTLIGGVSSSDAAANKGQDDTEAQSAHNSPLDETDLSYDDGEPEQFRVIPHPSNPARGNDFAYGDESGTIRAKLPSRRDAVVRTRRRDQSHMLLVGDPGTGKSQFLRFAAALCPRSVLTTGVGTTSAGLTCAAVREGNGKEFVLEAGALVLADKGVCCIDEFGCIRQQDRTTIHEAMEQQTLSVAKAGIVCKLNCRATVVAVMNPRGCLYDDHASLSRNTGLGTPLLSRFDIIFKLVDTSDAERDCNITTYLLNRAIQGAGFECKDDDVAGNVEEKPWNMEKLRSYISIVKDRFNPQLSDDAAQLLERHYEKCRMAESSTIPVTVRFLESMIRLSQAHARLMYRDVVFLEDAVAVVRIMESSAFAYGGFDGGVDDVENILYCDPMTMDFVPNPDMEFDVFMYRILKRYGMQDCMAEARRRSALEYLNAGPNCSSEGWISVENPRDANNPFAAAVEEDHYGRFRFNTNQDNVQTKKRRT